MNQKQVKSLYDDRDHWKKMCSKISDKQSEAQLKIMEAIDLLQCDEIDKLKVIELLREATL